MGATQTVPGRQQVPSEDPEMAVQDTDEEKRSKFNGFFYLGKGYFRSIDPDSYLFGEEGDLDYLPKAPSLFPYRRPQPADPTGVLKCLVHVQKESVKLVRIEGPDYRLEFKYDADVDFSVKVLQKVPRKFCLSELLTMSDLVSHEVQCQAGSGVQYEEDHILTFTDQEEDTLSVTDDVDRFPLAILISTVVGPDQRFLKQHHLTVVSIEKSSMESLGYYAKVLKQKLLSDDLEFVLQDLYGLENKGSVEEEEEGQDSDDGFDDADSGAECVICFTDVRDTVLLPCRHFCVCGSCAASLRYKASNCPICRAPFRALLRIQAVVKAEEEENIDEDGMEFPNHRVIPLMTALNGYPKYDPNATENADDNEAGDGSDGDSEGEGGGERDVEEGEEPREEDEEENEDGETHQNPATITPVEVLIESPRSEEAEEDGVEICQYGIKHKTSVLTNSSEDDIPPLPGTPVEDHEVLVIESSSSPPGTSSEEEVVSINFESRSSSIGSSKTSDNSISSSTRLV